MVGLLEGGRHERVFVVEGLREARWFRSATILLPFHFAAPAVCPNQGVTCYLTPKPNHYSKVLYSPVGV